MRQKPDFKKVNQAASRSNENVLMICSRVLSSVCIRNELYYLNSLLFTNLEMNVK